MNLQKWLGLGLLAAPALTQETLGCDCVAPTVTQYITIAGPTVTLCPDPDLSASQAITSSSTQPYMCAGNPCTSWIGGHSPASTDVVTFKPTTITQYPIPVIHSTSRRSKSFTVYTTTTTTINEDTDTTTITAAPVTVTVTTEPEPESTTTITELSTTTKHLTTTRTHGGAPLLATAHLSSANSSGHHSFTGLGNHGWNLTSSTARVNGTAQQTHRPSHGGQYTPSVKWNTITLPWGASPNSSPGQTSIATPSSPVRSHKPSATGWSVSFNTTSHHVPLPTHHKSTALTPPYANHTSAALVKRNVTVAVHDPILINTGCPVPPEELGNFIFSHQPSHMSEIKIKSLAPLATKNHLFANGYGEVDHADSETAVMFMPMLVQWYEVAHSVFPGGIGVGGNRVHDYFHFDAYGANVACASAQCQIRVVGYALNTADGSEAEKASEWFTIGGCDKMTEACKFTPMQFTSGFRDLTSIVFMASSNDKKFYMDHLELGWTMQDCDSAMKRHSSGE
ncbi:uncharacterized protein IWZ02DRAFT_52138 [Phyllosticta citriasiana]|uniref:uncharacterized protein n=1 Tax=Phyllosticta citriasiana TaxID=595635 RepID=UPI0030FD7570